MLAYSILLDGGFLKRKLGTAAKPCTAKDVVRFTELLREHELLRNYRLHRIYFYDAAPASQAVAKPFSKVQVNFSESATYKVNAAMHEALAREDFFANRLGELSFNGWIPKTNLARVRSASLTLNDSNIKPNISQKGVDMRIGLDIASLTLKKLSSVIVLVTGDSDFVPAMKFARREGAQLFLVTLGHGIKAPMFHHADVVLSRKVEDWMGVDPAEQLQRQAADTESGKVEANA